ncbi:MAG: hypothetical protein PHR15_03840 [Atopobiaceae bacterium]|jgi:hypothetical protein|nr:hypothetical protein [Atopobiaceae bacterium]MCH4214333.1 hypothetical protein [Atopobiaceae bacterium]MCH4276607.1 hypothetical protein [Atopobiaceae bacterium]MCI1227021.1 hypothetical protein [Atopobiaceae bacterium]MDD2588467.1 hypothetical protein [Atopobiaceae bacterium]
MRTGSRSGSERRRAPHGLGLSLFVDDEGGYTTVAFAVALLVSIALVFSLASAEWTLTRAADVQPVADACALAGANVVGAYSTVATTLDACVLTMGLAGVLVSGVGLVVSAIPGAQGLGAEVMGIGRRVLDARGRFATSAATGLRRLEATLPGLIVASSARVVSANSEGSQSFTGVAVPFPQTSESEWDGLDDELDTSSMEQDAAELQERTTQAEEAKAEADVALLEGWRADCGDEPYNLQQRAATLAGLSESENPDYPSVEGWNFGVALSRSRTYYAARAAGEVPEGQGIEELTDSSCRKAFFSYARGRMAQGHYRERADGTVDMDLPELPHDTDEVRSTTLYTDATWPLTQEAAGTTLHSTLACPGATGAAAGMGSLAGVDVGSSQVCPVCAMSVGDMGKVASASTNIDNGYEHHWRRVSAASRAYQDARERQAEAEAQMQETAEQGKGAFDQALEQLSVPRPKLCPAGAWGCIGVVARSDGSTTPETLAGSFVEGQALPGGVAVSAATLAPDADTVENNVLSRLFDGLAQGEEGEGVTGVLQGVTGLWGSLLEGYGSGYGDVADVADDLFSGIDGVFGTKVGSWLRDRLAESVRAMGLEPCDLRLKKPVLCNTQDVLDQAGAADLGTIRRYLEAIPDGGTPEEVAAALGQEVWNDLDTTFTVAEIPVPGTDLTIPLTIDLKDLGLGGSP